MTHEEPFRQIVAAHQDAIYRICCCYVRDDDERRDVYQETLIHIWENLDRFEGRAGLGTWIYRITVNTCLTFLRSERRRMRPLDSDGTAAAVADPASSTDARAMKDDVEELYAAIHRLPPLERTLIGLFLEDVGTAEMAQILGISEINVRVKMHRTRKRLKTMMEEH